MDFYADIIRIAKAELDKFEMDYADLSQDRKIVERWTNVNVKLIRPEPRNVVESAKVVAVPHDPTISPALSMIKTKFRRGEDVNPHLSRRIFYEDFTDYLFSDWNIYHLHLSMVFESGYFMSRSDSLLFVTIHDQCVYFIDIRPHNEHRGFAQKELLKIVHDEWPHVIERFRLPATGLVDNFDNPDEIETLRKAGLSIMHAFGSDVYTSPGGGITTAKTSLRVSLDVDMLYDAVKNVMEYIQQNESTIRRRIASRLGLPPIIMDFHLEWTNKGFLVVEQNSNYKFPLFPPKY
jgi:hypothetical protein